MRLFIPEIGTQLKLLQDWKFTLVPEGRNDTLAELNGYHHMTWHKYGGSFWLKHSEIEPQPQYDYSTIVWPTREEIDKACRRTFGRYDYDTENQMRKRAQEASPEFVASVNRNNDWQGRLETATKYNKIKVTIPAGAILKVDRIYIRKGSEQYSSVSFFWNNNPTNKKVRFFAKLKHCNEIECEIVV